MLSSAFLLSQAVSFATIPYMIEKVGGQRKLWICMSYALGLVYTGLILSKKIDFSIFLMSLNGFIAGQCATIYVYAASFVAREHVGILSTFFMAYDGLTTFTQACYFCYISKNYHYYFYFVVGESLLLAVLGHAFLLENNQLVTIQAPEVRQSR